MSPSRPPRWRAPISWRRVARAALLALQVGFALAPLVEHRDPVRPTSHADEQGTRHRFAHDEGSCVVCAVRTIVAEAPAEPGFLLDAEARRDVIASAPSRIASRLAEVTHRPRGPPVQG